MNASPIDASPISRAAVFPFAALLGQTTLQQALLLAAIDPGIGGVLVSGPRGTAKSTAARALAELLPEGQFVTLPLNASEERLAGTLDLQTALRDSTVRFAPGLLAAAHRGVLYVDEVNLLPDALVDALLDAAASGVNTVEPPVSVTFSALFAPAGTPSAIVELLAKACREASSMARPAWTMPRFSCSRPGRKPVVSSMKMMGVL